METIDIEDAKTHLSRLIEHGARGESFVIAIGGKPMARLTPPRVWDKGDPQLIGSMRRKIRVPDDFDVMGQAEIEELFGGC